MTDREHRRSEELPRKESYVEPREGTALLEKTTTTSREMSPMGRGAGYLRGITWGAVFAGAIVAFVSMVVLNLLGIAIGAAVLDVGAEQSGLGIGAGIWWTISVLISLFFGGWVAGRLSNSMDRGEGMIHGLVTWGLVVVASLFALTTTVGTILGGAFTVLGEQLSAVINQADFLASLELEALAAGVSPEQISEAQAQAVIAADQAANALAMGAGWAFVALILGMLIAGFGSLLGAGMPTEEKVERSDKARRVLRPRHA